MVGLRLGIIVVIILEVCVGVTMEVWFHKLKSHFSWKQTHWWFIVFFLLRYLYYLESIIVMSFPFYILYGCFPISKDDIHGGDDDSNDDNNCQDNDHDDDCGAVKVTMTTIILVIMTNNNYNSNDHDKHNNDKFKVF